MLYLGQNIVLIFKYFSTYDVFSAHYLKIRTFSKIWELDTVKMSTNLIKKAKIKTITYEENLQRIS